VRAHPVSSRRRLLAAAGGAAALLASPAATAQAQAQAQWKTAGLSGALVYGLIADRTSPGSLFALTRTGTVGRTSIAKSMDGGQSWFGLERGLPVGFQPTAFACGGDDGRLAVAAGVDGAYRSVNGGISWQRLAPRLPALTALAFDRTDPRVVLAGSELEGNFRSQDGGLTWRPANRGLLRDRYGVTPGAVLLAQHPANPKTWLMAASAAAPVFRSEDGGASWHEAATGLPRGTVVGLAFANAGADSADTAFVLFERGLFRTTNRGGAWQAVNGPVDPAALYVDPDVRDHVYVATASGALHRTTNGGTSWAELASLPRPVRGLTSWGGGSQASALATLGAAAGEGVWQLLLRPTLPFSPAPPANNRMYFPQTGHNVSPTFYPFFLSRGGLERFGLPRTEELVENGVLVQYFQRARLEHRPDMRGTPYEVQISLLGEQLLGRFAAGPVEPFESSADQRYFEETGHSVNYAFLRYFTARGGLDSFGYPITEEMHEDGRPVQYFQRARLEYRAELAGRPDEVAVGLLGDEALRRKGWLD
jgi:photosystem II stability/assembly factor-like uncharacterized protein